MFFTSILFGFFYSVFLSYPDQFASPFTFVKDLSTSEPMPSSYLVGVGYLPLDSLGYILNSKNFSINEIASFDSLLILAGQYQNIILYYISKLSHYCNPENPYIIISIVNHLFLFLAMRNYYIVMRLLGINPNLFFSWISINIIIIYAIYSLNKEIVGLFLISEFVLFAYRPNYFRVFFVLFLALITRNVFFVFGFLIILNHFVKFHSLFIFLIFSTVIVPGILFLTDGAVLGADFGQLDEAANNWGQQSSKITTYFYEYSKYPAGYIINYPIVLAVNVLSPILNFQYWHDYLSVFNLSQFILQLSSFMFSILFYLNIRNGRLYTVESWNSPFKFFFYYTMITSLFPFSQHRYLLPIFPVLVLSYLYFKSKHSKIERLNNLKK